MTETVLTFRFRLTGTELADGMLLCRHRLKSWPLRLLSALPGGLGMALIGALAGKLVAAMLALGGPAEFAVMIVAMILGLAAFQALGRQFAIDMAKDTIESPFQRVAVEWHCAVTGLRMRGTHHDWQTGWQGVTQIVEGKDIFVRQIAGMIFLLPHRVSGGMVDVAATLHGCLDAAKGHPK